jgi:DNA-3-methyladenine glycosylase I
MDDPIRCCCLSSDLYKEYHDQEWGTPVYDDATLFEFLILETFQAGLSWITILNKGRISGKRLTISTIKNSPYSEDKIQALYWTQESFVTN